MRWGRCRRFFRRTLDPGAGGRPPCLYGKGNGAQRGKAICPSHTANSAGAGPGWGAQGGVRGVWREGEHPDFLSRCPQHTAFSVKLTPWTVAHQAPLSIGFSRQGLWSGLPFLSPASLAQVLNLGLLHCRQILFHLSYQGRPHQTSGDGELLNSKLMPGPSPTPMI